MKLDIKRGDKFGMLTIVKEVERFVQPSGQGQRGFLCKCDCGGEKKVRLSHLVHNRVRSCRCISGSIHGESKTRLYRIWRGMIDRTSEKHIQPQYYFDKGITVCIEWRKYIPFRDWAKSNGYSDNLQIDRTENDKGYYPDNCRWVTCQVNCLNKDNTLKITYKGIETPLKSILREKGKIKHYEAIRNRLIRGWNDEKAVDTPIRKGNYFRGKRT